MSDKPNGEYLDLVRFRNDGDDFHILWTARRALRLLSPTSGLVAVAVEGLSPRDHHKGRRLEDGLLVADAVDYYGSEEFASADRIIIDRKSVVEGKRGPVRVEDGGTGNYKKKK